MGSVIAVEEVGADSFEAALHLLKRFFCEEGFHTPAHQMRASLHTMVTAPGSAVFLARRGNEAVGVATVNLTMPGMRLVHQGQMEGYRLKLPLQLGRRSVEPPQLGLEPFYRRLLAALRHPCQIGPWQCTNQGAHHLWYHPMLDIVTLPIPGVESSSVKIPALNRAQRSEESRSAWVVE